MPVLRDFVARMLNLQDEQKTVTPGSEVAYSESLFNASANARKYDPDQLKSRKGWDIYRRMMLDEQVKAVTRFRRDVITGREYLFQFDKDSNLSETEQEKRIKLFSHIIEDMDGSFNDGLNAVMTGMTQGYSITEKVFDVIDYDGRPWIGLKALKRKPHETFKFEVDRYGNVLKLIQEIDGHEIKVPIDKVIHYVQNPEVDEHYGGSELREAYRAWFAKDVAIKFWNIYLERAAGGVWVARPKDGHTVVAGTTEHQNILAVLQSMSASSSVLLPSSIEMEFIQPNSTSEFENAVQYHDLAIAKSLLVPNLLGLSHTGQTGAFAQSQTQFKAFMLVLQADTVRLQSALNEQLFRELGELNYADGEYPRFKFKPMSIDQIIEILGVWNELVGKDTVEPSDTDEDHIRQLLEMPEKGEPLPRRQPPVAGNPFQQPDPDANPTNQPNQNAEDRQTPDDVVAAWDRAAWKVSFTRALKRVRFQVIDRKSQDQVEQTVVRLRNDIANAMEDIFVMIEEGGFGGEDTAIEGVSEIKFTPAHKKKIKNTCNNVLTKSWKLGMNHADSEMKAAAKVAASREDWDRQKFAIIPGSGFLEVFPFDLERRAAEYLTETSFGMSASITKDIEKLIENVMLNGIKFSWSTEKIVQVIIEKLISKGFQTVEDWVSSDHQKKTPDEMDEALEGLGINADRLRTTVRTSYFDIVNEARFAYFNDPALGDFVQAMEYSAILDSRTTNICRHLDGKIFSKDSELWNEYRPPNHFNCRSILVAVTADDVWEESRPPTIDPQSGFGS